MKIVVQMLEGDDKYNKYKYKLVKNTSSERVSCHLRMRVEANFNTLNTSSMYRCNLTLSM